VLKPNSLIWVVVGPLFFLNTVAAIVSGQAGVGTPETKKERLDARRLWDQVVTARGGRARLHSISNMVLTKDVKPTDVYTDISVFAFPNRFWQWSRFRVVKEGLFVTMANLDDGVFLVAGNTGLVTNQTGLDERKRANYRETYLIDGCSFLLETKWLQPTPVRIRRETVGREPLDVIETYFPDLQVYRNFRQDFYVDPESLEVKGVEQLDDKGKGYGYYSFVGSTNVEGIQVPKSFNIFRRASDVRKTSYTPLYFQFNVSLDEGLFKRIPAEKDGPDAWKALPQKK
jgi:hypothetical protein